MSEPEGGIPAGAQVTFVQDRIPPLRSGEVTVTATQVVEAKGQAQTFVAAQRVSVTGARYRLEPGMLASVFPPPGSQGEFTNVLPHVVLSPPSLPWQRSPGAGGETAPWLAVLPFCALDPPPAPRAATLTDLRWEGTTFFPPRAAEDRELDGDPVTVIDVPVALFAAVAPAADDLSWLAHVRHVDVSEKPAGDDPALADCGVVIGNRLGTAGQATTAYLVSLEGWGPYLPAADGTPSSALPAGTEAVRLVVLHEWTFSSVDQQQTFAGLLTAVDLSPAGMQLPVHAVPSDDPAADAAVASAFGLGYTAMDHALADGDPTVSWYRGPLLPRPSSAEFVSPPYAAASPLLRYDPTTGMFDVSYASAWELGRLLALRDNAYATALYRWKLTQAQSAVDALEARLLDETLAALGSAPGDGDPRQARFAAAAAGVAAPAAARVAADSAS